MNELRDWLLNLEWQRLIPELIGKGLGFLLGFAASWFLLFRRHLLDLRKLQSGDSDDVLFQLHQLCPFPAPQNASPPETATAGSDANPQQFTLIFRNVTPSTTVDRMYDNQAARRLLREMADATSLQDPVLQSSGTVGFEIVNDALGHVAGHLAVSPFERETWLFMMTCEDRQLVRKKCIRCFLIRPDDLERFYDWGWCSRRVRVEKPWHWFRIVALHFIAKEYRQQLERESKNRADRSLDQPLVDPQLAHDRIRLLSVGLSRNEQPIDSQAVNWQAHLDRLQSLGLNLNVEQLSPTAPAT